VTGGGAARERRIGVIVPFDFALDREYWQWTPSDVSLHITRTPPHFGPVGIELARAVAEPGEAADATETLVEIKPDSIAFACTSGSFVDGLAAEGELRSAIEAKSGGAPAITTSGALLVALRALGVRRVGIGTPYVSSLGARLGDFLREADFEPVSIANLELEAGIADVAADEVEALAAGAFTPDAEAIFLSCTNLRTFEELPRLEARYGVPVLSANQVTMWSALRAAGASLPDVPQRLFRVPAPRAA
jgi:maleate isomerase